MEKNKLGLSCAKLSLNWASKLKLPLIIICIQLYRTTPINVTKKIQLISSYQKLSSIEVVFPGGRVLTLQKLEN